MGCGACKTAANVGTPGKRPPRLLGQDPLEDGASIVQEEEVEVEEPDPAEARVRLSVAPTAGGQSPTGKLKGRAGGAQLPELSSGDWKGYYTENGSQHLLPTFFLGVDAEGLLQGNGTDSVGEYQLAGEVDAEGRVTFDKTYQSQGYAVLYRGVVHQDSSGLGIRGRWELDGDSGAFHIYPAPTPGTGRPSIVAANPTPAGLDRQRPSVAAPLTSAEAPPTMTTVVPGPRATTSVVIQEPLGAQFTEPPPAATPLVPGPSPSNSVVIQEPLDAHFTEQPPAATPLVQGPRATTSVVIQEPLSAHFTEQPPAATLVPGSSSLGSAELLDAGGARAVHLPPEFTVAEGGNDSPRSIEIPDGSSQGSYVDLAGLRESVHGVQVTVDEASLEEVSPQLQPTGATPIAEGEANQADLLEDEPSPTEEVTPLLQQATEEVTLAEEVPAAEDAPELLETQAPEALAAGVEELQPAAVEALPPQAAGEVTLVDEVRAAQDAPEMQPPEATAAGLDELPPAEVEALPPEAAGGVTFVDDVPAAQDAPEMQPPEAPAAGVEELPPAEVEALPPQAAGEVHEVPAAQDAMPPPEAPAAGVEELPPAEVEALPEEAAALVEEAAPAAQDAPELLPQQTTEEAAALVEEAAPAAQDAPALQSAEAPGQDLAGEPAELPADRPLDVDLLLEEILADEPQALPAAVESLPDAEAAAALEPLGASAEPQGEAAPAASLSFSFGDVPQPDGQSAEEAPASALSFTFGEAPDTVQAGEGVPPVEALHGEEEVTSPEGVPLLEVLGEEALAEDAAPADLQPDPLEAPEDGNEAEDDAAGHHRRHHHHHHHHHEEILQHLHESLHEVHETETPLLACAEAVGPEAHGDRGDLPDAGDAGTKVTSATFRRGSMSRTHVDLEMLDSEPPEQGSSPGAFRRSSLSRANVDLDLLERDHLESREVDHSAHHVDLAQLNSH